jgi:hypothetical protein
VAANDSRRGLQVSFSAVGELSADVHLLHKTHHIQDWHQERRHPIDSLFEQESFIIAAEYALDNRDEKRQGK